MTPFSKGQQETPGPRPRRLLHTPSLKPQTGLNSIRRRASAKLRVYLPTPTTNACSAKKSKKETCVGCAPYSKYPLFLGYHVDPLLKKEVFTAENQVIQTNPEKKRVFGVRGMGAFFFRIRTSDWWLSFPCSFEPTNTLGGGLPSKTGLRARLLCRDALLLGQTP